MIFPELPRRTEFYSGSTVKTPLREVEVQEEPVKVDVEAWFIKQGLAVDPAAGSYSVRRNEQINWLAKDAGELYILITVYAVWLTYWLGVHREWW